MAIEKGTSRDYSDDEIALLAKWLREGLSSRQIAARLSAERGHAVTRNAVIGVIYRNSKLSAIGLRPAPKAGGAVSVRKEAKARKPAAVAPRVVRPLEKLGARHEGLSAALFQAARQERLAPEPVEGAAPRHVPLVALGAFECRFPVNNAAPGEQHLFCGLPARSGPYCTGHAARVVARAA